MRDANVERTEQHFTAIRFGIDTSEVVPKAEGNAWQ
jgi:hypothetical protein